MKYRSLPGENSLEEVQGATTSSHIPPPLLQDPQICSFKPEGVATVRSSELLAKLELEDLDLFLRERRLRGAVRTACDIQIDGKQGAGRPKLTWKRLTEKECRELKLTTVDPQERST